MNANLGAAIHRHVTGLVRENDFRALFRLVISERYEPEPDYEAMKKAVLAEIETVFDAHIAEVKQLR